MNVIRQTTPKKHLPILALTLLGFALRLAFLGRQSLWYDEAFSLVVAAAPWNVLWTALLSDGVHPPGYYLLLRSLLPLFGDSEFGLRYLSALAGTGAIPLLGQVARYCWTSDRAGYLAALLLALNPFALWYAQEARQYALLLTLATAGLWTFFRFLERPTFGRWWPFTIVTALSFQFHYFALVFVLAQFVYLLITLRRHYRALRRWIAAQIIAAIPLLPWLIAVATRSGRNFGIGWIQPASPVDPLLTLANLTFGLSNPASVLTWLALFLLVLIFSFSAASGQRLAVSLTFLLTPILFTFLISLRLPLYVDRFLIVSLPALLLGLSGSGRLSSPGWLEHGTILVLVVATGLACGRIFFDPALTKEDWRIAARYVAARERAGDILAMRQFQDRLPFGHYYQGQRSIIVISTNRETTPMADITAGARRLWIIQRRPFASTHALAGNAPLHWADETDPIVGAWYQAHADQLIEEKTFPGIYLLLFELEEP